jgi:hypothetical protein
MGKKQETLAMPRLMDVTPEDSEIAEVKAKLCSLGWFVRYTEWPSGHQVVLHRRSDTAAHLVAGWCASELGAWREALRLALGEGPEHHAPDGPG